MANFQLDPEADTNATANMGTISLIPKHLIEHFGEPAEADGYKVSGMYCFVDGAGNVYTLYDWKTTSLYDDGLEAEGKSSLPTPHDFWSERGLCELQIGGRRGCDIEAFKAWLSEKLP